MQKRRDNKYAATNTSRTILDKMDNGWIFTEVFGNFYEQVIEPNRDINPVNRASPTTVRGLYYLLDNGYIEKNGNRFKKIKEYDYDKNKSNVQKVSI